LLRYPGLSGTILEILKSRGFFVNGRKREDAIRMLEKEHIPDNLDIELPI